MPIFRGHAEDNPAQHLHEFHELMHQWGIHHEDVLLKMFIYSLAGDAREWYHSLPPASISSLGGFHAAFNRHCQRYYSSEFFCYNYCEGYEGHDQDLAYYDRSYEDEDEEGDDALIELMDLVKSLSAKKSNCRQNVIASFFRKMKRIFLPLK